ncbi:hypothetical protein GQ600_1257 [Phytophthora cactorum]|nr:hypothetical protein GQ600_1257 [Phytophthora cactorum]
MWNQSEVLGTRARRLCPPGINWLGDADFKIWPFLMVPYDEHSRKRFTRTQRCLTMIELGYVCSATTITSPHSEF